MSRLRKRKGDVVSPTIMWIGVILAVLIAGAWFMTKLRPVQHESETLRFDLSEMKIAVDKACTSTSFLKKYNPRTEKGDIKINSTHICINITGISDCSVLSCNISNSLEEDLSKITYIIIEKEKDIKVYTEKSYEGDSNAPSIVEINVKPKTGKSSTKFTISATVHDMSGIGWLAFSITNPSGKTIIKNITEKITKYNYIYNETAEEGNYVVDVSVSDIVGNSAVYKNAAYFDVNNSDTTPPEVVDFYATPDVVYINGKVDIIAVIKDESEVTASIDLKEPNGSSKTYDLVNLGDDKYGISLSEEETKVLGTYTAELNAYDLSHNKAEGQHTATFEVTDVPQTSYTLMIIPCDYNGDYNSLKNFAESFKRFWLNALPLSKCPEKLKVIYPDMKTNYGEHWKNGYCDLSSVSMKGEAHCYQGTEANRIIRHCKDEFEEATGESIDTFSGVVDSNIASYSSSRDECNYNIAGWVNNGANGAISEQSNWVVAHELGHAAFGFVEQYCHCDDSWPPKMCGLGISLPNPLKPELGCGGRNTDCQTGLMYESTFPGYPPCVWVLGNKGRGGVGRTIMSNQGGTQYSEDEYQTISKMEGMECGS